MPISHLRFPLLPFLLLLLLLLSTHSTPFDQILLAKRSSDLIQQTCKNTKYYELCVSSLQSDSSSPKLDTKDLALIMVRVGIANATATSSYISFKIGSTKNDTVMKKVLKECSEKYSFASDALQSAVQDLNGELYDYVYMHVMAAADYPNACHNGFRRYSGLAYPLELAAREEGLKNICDVILGIVDTFGP